MENSNLHPTFVQILERIMPRQNGTNKGFYALEQSLRRNWTNEQKSQHASKLIERCAKIENECLIAIEENKYNFPEFDKHYKAFLKYHAICLRLIEYRMNLFGKSLNA